MAPLPPLDSLSHAEKDALILALLARVEVLCARVAELEAKLGLPPKTPDNSSTPPSKGQKASAPAAGKSEGKRKPHAGAHRPLHPNPTTRRDIAASSCRHCGADVSQSPQFVCEAYDHVEIPPITPQVTRVSLLGGTCPCCAKKFKAEPPADMPKGSPFGENLRALVIYLRFTQGIAFERLSTLLYDMLGLEISEGALVNMLEASRDAFAKQVGAIRAKLLSGTLAVGRNRAAGRQEQLVAVGVPPSRQRRLPRRADAGQERRCRVPRGRLALRVHDAPRAAADQQRFGARTTPVRRVSKDHQRFSHRVGSQALCRHPLHNRDSPPPRHRRPGRDPPNPRR
jgi:hypothetical protein